MGVALLNPRNVAGADEAGRGPLAGPVVCAAVMLPAEFDIEGLNDSKKLNARQRETLANRIKQSATFAIEIVGPEVIDQINILQASLMGMQRAISRLSPPPSQALIDGNKVPKNLSIPSEAIVKGDGKYACIAAASILAKTERDRIMVELSHKHPLYGFDQHFGYPTPEHLAAIAHHGPCVIHRRSFRPIRNDDQPPLF